VGVGGQSAKRQADQSYKNARQKEPVPLSRKDSHGYGNQGSCDRNVRVRAQPERSRAKRSPSELQPFHRHFNNPRYSKEKFYLSASGEIQFM
jgi:hypothetical protein